MVNGLCLSRSGSCLVGSNCWKFFSWRHWPSVPVEAITRSRDAIKLGLEEEGAVGSRMIQEVNYPFGKVLGSAYVVERFLLSSTLCTLFPLPVSCVSLVYMTLSTFSRFPYAIKTHCSVTRLDFAQNAGHVAPSSVPLRSSTLTWLIDSDVLSKIPTE